MRKGRFRPSFFRLGYSNFVYLCSLEKKRLNYGIDPIDGGDRREAFQVPGTDPGAHLRARPAAYVVH